MRLAIVLTAGLLLAGCSASECKQPATLNMGVGVGASGAHPHMSVGQGCGPLHVTVGTGGLGLVL